MERGLSHRKACTLLELCRSRLFYHPRVNPEREKLRQAIKEASTKHPTYGYRKIWAKLIKQHSHLHMSRVYRFWKAEGLALPPKKKRRRRKFGEGSVIPPRKALYPNHVWCYDFVKVRLRNGQYVRILTLLDEFTRESLGLFIALSIPASKVLAFLKEAILARGCMPQYLRSDNGPEFIEYGLNQWLKEKGVRPIFIEPGSPWQNGKCESFNGKFRTEFLDRNPDLMFKELIIRTEWWRNYYNQERPHSALDYQTPLEFAQLWYTQNTGVNSPLQPEAPRAPSIGEKEALQTRRSKRFLASGAKLKISR